MSARAPRLALLGAALLSMMRPAPVRAWDFDDAPIEIQARELDVAERVARADNTDTPAGCDCEVTIDSSLSSADTYTADETAGEITVGTGGDERTYDYCVEGGDLRFRDTSADEQEPGIQTLTPDPAS